MTNTRKVIYASILTGLLVYGWRARHKADRRADEQISSQSLPLQDSGKVIVDEQRHTITTVVAHSGRPGSNASSQPIRRTVYLPPHAAVEIKKDGSIKVDARTWGTEVSPWLGFAYSDRARVALGLDLLYWHRWELGPFVGFTISGPFSARIGAKVSFNVWSNTSLYVGIDNRGTSTGGICFKF